MADHPTRRSIADLETALRELGQDIDYPPTPDLASAVRARIAESAGQVAPSRVNHARRVRPTLVLAAALALVLLASLFLAVSPATREAVADRFGLNGILFTSESPLASPPAVPAGSTLNLGTRISLEEAARRLPFTILLPQSDHLGEPDEIFLGYPPETGQLWFVYRDRAALPTEPETGVSLLLSEFQGTIEPGLFMKGLAPGTQVTPVTVNGQQGFWVDGEAHLFFYRDANGDVRDETVRLAGNVLLWERGEVTLRLEGDLSKDEALRIAATVR